VRYSRSYLTSLGAVALDSSTNSSDYGVYGRAGWINRLSARDEIAASVELWQLWQRVNGYSDPSVAFNPFNASVATGTGSRTVGRVPGDICRGHRSAEPGPHAPLSHSTNSTKTEPFLSCVELATVLKDSASNLRPVSDATSAVGLD